MMRPSTNPPLLEEIISKWEALERVPDSLPNNPEPPANVPVPSAEADIDIIQGKLADVFGFDGLPDGATDYLPDAPNPPPFEDDFFA